MKRMKELKANFKKVVTGLKKDITRLRKEIDEFRKEFYAFKMKTSTAIEGLRNQSKGLWDPAYSSKERLDRIKTAVVEEGVMYEVATIEE